MIVMCTIDKEPAGISAEDISMILPDVSNPKRAVVYTALLPNGMTVDQSPIDMIVEWSNALDPIEESEEESE